MPGLQVCIFVSLNSSKFSTQGKIVSTPWILCLPLHSLIHSSRIAYWHLAREAVGLIADFTFLLSPKSNPQAQPYPCGNLLCLPFLPGPFSSRSYRSWLENSLLPFITLFQHPNQTSFPGYSFFFFPNEVEYYSFEVCEEFWWILMGIALNL